MQYFCCNALTAASVVLGSLTVSLRRGIFRKGGYEMKKYVCNICGYIYDPAEGDPDNGVAPGTAWEDVPEEWVCPLCGAPKDDFSEE